MKKRTRKTADPEARIRRARNEAGPFRVKCGGGYRVIRKTIPGS
jgi:hypothetical protein